MIYTPNKDCVNLCTANANYNRTLYVEKGKGTELIEIYKKVNEDFKGKERNDNRIVNAFIGYLNEYEIDFDEYRASGFIFSLTEENKEE